MTWPVALVDGDRVESVRYRQVLVCPALRGELVELGPACVGVVLEQPAVTGESGDVVHRHGCDGLDPGVDGGGVQGESPGGADADNADPFAVDLVQRSEEVDAGAEILGEEFW
jgi:hypothetical protein